VSRVIEFERDTQPDAVLHVDRVPHSHERVVPRALRKARAKGEEIRSSHKPTIPPHPAYFHQRKNGHQKRLGSVAVATDFVRNHEVAHVLVGEDERYLLVVGRQVTLGLSRVILVDLAPIDTALGQLVADDAA